MRNTTEPMPATEAVTNDVPGAEGVVNVDSTAPLAPLVAEPALSDPPVAVQATVTPDTGFPTRSVTRTLSSVLAPAITATESALSFTRADACPAMPFATRVAVLVPTIASSELTFTVSLIVQVVLATPDESVPDTVSETTPLPVVGFQLTGTPRTGCPPSVTVTLTRLELPAGIVRLACAESTATLNVLPLLPVLSGPGAELALLEHAATAVRTTADTTRVGRIPLRHAPRGFSWRPGPSRPCALTSGPDAPNVLP